MEKIYMNGKAYIPEKDILICNVQESDPLMCSLAVTAEYERLYATTKGAFYKVKWTTKRKSACILSKEDAAAFLEENAAYILTSNYDKVFGQPERG